MWTCDAARAIWAESSRAIQKCATEAKDFLSILNDLSDRLAQEELEFVAFIAQKLWTRRNQWVFEGTFVNPKQGRREGGAGRGHGPPPHNFLKKKIFFR
jgi:hypothetical protein